MQLVNNGVRVRSWRQVPVTPFLFTSLLLLNFTTGSPDNPPPPRFYPQLVRRQPAAVPFSKAMPPESALPSEANAAVGRDRGTWSERRRLHAAPSKDEVDTEVTYKILFIACRVSHLFCCSVRLPPPHLRGVVYRHGPTFYLL